MKVLPASGSVMVWQIVTGVSSGVVLGVSVTTGASLTGVTVTGIFAVSHKPVLSQMMRHTVSGPL